MADTTEAARKRLSFIRNSYASVSGPFRYLWHWGNRRQKLLRFQSLQKWATQRLRAAKTRKAKRKWAAKREQYKAKVEQLQTPQTGCGDPGSPHWAGAASIVEREIVPVFERRGVPITSRKRTSTLGNPSSDHYIGNTTAYAVDAGTYDGADDARAVAASLGFTNYTIGNYNHYFLKRCGRTFRVQILWAVSGHFNHVHVGVRRV